MIRARRLDSQPRVRHAFFTREGGVSDGIYASLNCGLGSDDVTDAVVENRARAMARLERPADELVTAYQVHSANVVEVTEPWAPSRSPEVDGLVTRTPGVALGVLSADCAPVLFADAEAGVVGAAHAGWKGALGGVLDATVAAMRELGAETRRISAVVGPCIAQASYEVGAEFRNTFLAADAASDRFFVAGARDGKYQFDLPGYATARLEALGVSTEATGQDTCVDDRRFFSYRRATHRNESDYGRGLSAILLES